MPFWWLVVWRRHRPPRWWVSRAVSSIHAAGLPAGILGYGEEIARGFFETDGIEFVAIAGDAWLLARHMDRMIGALRG